MPPLSVKPTEYQPQGKRTQELFDVYGQTEHQRPTADIIKLGVITMSTEDIIKQSVTTQGGIHSTEDQGYFTLNDPRLGAYGKVTICPSCDQPGGSGCMGHLGHIVLPRPVFNPVYIDYIVAVLKVVCADCGNLIIGNQTLVDNHVLEINGIDRLRKMEGLLVNRVCKNAINEDDDPNIQRCARNPKYSKHTGGLGIVSRENTKATPNAVSVTTVKKIFDMITEEDAATMGFLVKFGQHPRNFIMEVLPVLPQNRRGNTFIDGKLNKDDLTSHYLEILKYINQYTAAGNDDERDSAYNNLNQQINSFFVGKRDPAGTGHSFKSISESLGGRDGTFRNHLMGKRLNFAARTLATGDSRNPIGVISVPLSFKADLLIPISVDATNLDEMKELLLSGEITNVFITTGLEQGRMLVVTDSNREELVLQPGYIVERHLRDGDIVLIGRNPTVQTEGLMAQVVRLVDNDTFSMCLPTTGPYNCDFDGDELNLAASIKTVEAWHQATTLMLPETCVLSAQNNTNMIGVTFDNVVAVYIMIKENEVMTPTRYYHLLEQTNATDRNPPMTSINVAAVDGDDWKTLSRKAHLELDSVQAKHIRYRYQIRYGGKFLDCTIGMSNEAIADFFQVDEDEADQLPAIDLQPHEETVFFRGETFDQRLQKYGIEPFSGKALFSALLPYDFEYSYGGVTVKEGILLSGEITSKITGTGRHTMIKALANPITPRRGNALSTLDAQKRAALFMSDLAVLDFWLTDRGFTVGVKDCWATPDILYEDVRDKVLRQQQSGDEEEIMEDGDVIMEEFERTVVVNGKKRTITVTRPAREPKPFLIESARKLGKDVHQLDPVELQMVTDNYHRTIVQGKINNIIRQLDEFDEPETDVRLEQARQTQFSTAISGLLAELAELTTAHLGPDNRFLDMINSGSKGNMTQLRSIVSAMGQYYGQGKRVAPADSVDPVTNQRRPRRGMAYFELDSEKHADITKAGFATNALVDGISEIEHVYNQIQARDGISQMAVGTAKTGSIQRKLVKFLEGVITYPDRSARVNGHIIQFVYGNDGMNPAQLGFSRRKENPYRTFFKRAAAVAAINREHETTPYNA